MKFQKGHPSYWTDETKKKVGKSIKKMMTPAMRMRISKKLKGRKLSKETKKKISDYLTGRPSPIKGKHTWSLESRKKFSESRRGANSPSWKGGKKHIHKVIRAGIEFRLWREAIFARDNWTCQKCQSIGKFLHPHHILNFAEYPKLRFAIDNGITLCNKCHRKFHKEYGFKKNTEEQLQIFLRKEVWKSYEI